jgi:hypothetical protein
MRPFVMHANIRELVTSASALYLARISNFAFVMMVEVSRKIYCEKEGSATLD